MFVKIIQALKAQPHAAPLTDEKEIKNTYRHFRIQMMVTMIVGYAVFYFVRKNFSMAMPTFLKELGYTKTDLGFILSLFSVIYGLGKFWNGILADRANPRYFMALGLIGSAIVNVFFGWSSSLTFFGTFWLLNAYFQSMGWPPCARMLAHWYAPKESGTLWGIWHISHQIGGAGVMILVGYLIPSFGWRSAFFVPAGLAILTSFFLMHRLRDTPQSLGLPPIEEYKREAHVVDGHEDTAQSVREILVQHVLTNKLVWLVSFGNFFVYIVRMGVLDWAPTFLVEAKGSSLLGAGYKVAGYEIAGMFGAIAAGWISDKIFKGRRGPVCVLFMAMLTLALFYFWKVPAGYPWLDAACLFAVGFVVYGPQLLVVVAASDFASKKAAATATGMTGTFGYLGATFCGIGTGMIVDRFGWDGGFIFFITAALLGTLCFTAIWHHRSPALEAIHNSKKSAVIRL